MNYELAKKLKVCSDCEKPTIFRTQSFRCKECQQINRRKQNKIWQHTYYVKNKERINKRVVERQNIRRATDEEYRQKELTKYHNRRALIEGNGGRHTTKEWNELVKKYDNKCASCKQEKKLTRDHIIPLSRGGSNNIDNIQPLCGSCNSSKNNYAFPRIAITA